MGGTKHEMQEDPRPFDGFDCNEDEDDNDDIDDKDDDGADDEEHEYKNADDARQAFHHRRFFNQPFRLSSRSKLSPT